MQDPSVTASTQNKITRVGIIVVHGIGRQSRFEHLTEVVNNLVSVFRDDTKLDVEIIVDPRNTTAYNYSDDFNGDAEIWIKDSKVISSVSSMSSSA